MSEKQTKRLRKLLKESGTNNVSLVPKAPKQINDLSKIFKGIKCEYKLLFTIANDIARAIKDSGDELNGYINILQNTLPKNGKLQTIINGYSKSLEDISNKFIKIIRLHSNKIVKKDEDGNDKETYNIIKKGLINPQLGFEIAQQYEALSRLILNIRSNISIDILKSLENVIDPKDKEEIDKILGRQPEIEKVPDELVEILDTDGTVVKPEKVDEVQADINVDGDKVVIDNEESTNDR